MITWAKTEWRHFRQTLKRCGNDDIGLLAASMAYYATFSFFPLLLLLIALLGFALGFSTGAQDAQQELLDLLAKNTSAGFAENVRIALAEIRTGAAVGGPLGLVALVLAAIAIFTTLERALDRVWDTRRRSKGILAAVGNALFRRFRAFLMFLGVGLLVFVVFMAEIVFAAVRTFAVRRSGVCSRSRPASCSTGCCLRLSIRSFPRCACRGPRRCVAACLRRSFGKPAGSC